MTPPAQTSRLERMLVVSSFFCDFLCACGRGGFWKAIGVIGGVLGLFWSALWGLGAALGVILETLGCHWVSFLGYWGHWGSILGVDGYPWEPSARNRLQRPMVSFTPPPLWTIFEPKGSRTGPQNGVKICKKNMQNSVKKHV